MTVLRTPQERFADLPGFPYQAAFAESLKGFEGLRMAYLDEGPKDASRVFLCLHGQPTWSYLYRKMIPLLLATGARVVAPDLFGFGRSDKPSEESFYTFESHRNALLAFVEALDLKHVTLVVQDWGGILGLTLPMDAPQRYERLIVMNTTLATGEEPLTEGFVAWRAWNNANPDMAIGKLLKRGCPQLSDAEAAAYEAPYPTAEYKSGVRRFPNLVPDRPDAPGAAISRKARDFWSTQWAGQSFMAIGAADPVLGEPVMRSLAKAIRGCPEPLVLKNGGHFVQEWGEEVVPAALASFDRKQ